MRRRFALVLVALALPAMAGCGSSPRDHARSDFVNQLATEGGISHEQATCIVDKFFEHRTNDELKAFFARKTLTEAERSEFAALGTQCVAPTSVSAPATQA